MRAFAAAQTPPRTCILTIVSVGGGLRLRGEQKWIENPREFIEIPREFIEFYWNLSVFIEIQTPPLCARPHFLLNPNRGFRVAFSRPVE